MPKGLRFDASQLSSAGLRMTDRGQKVWQPIDLRQLSSGQEMRLNGPLLDDHLFFDGRAL
jgi:hypothetical protein